MLRKVAVIIEEESLITNNTNMIFFGIHNLSNEVSALNTQIEITALSEVKLNCQNSAHRAMTLNNVAVIKIFVGIRSAI